MSWRLAKHRYELVGTRCTNAACGRLDFPPRSVCISCDGAQLEKYKFSGEGMILSYTIIHTAPEGFEKQTPYAIALVQLSEGPVVSAHVVGDTSKIAINKKVRMVFRKLYEDGRAGVISYGFKFEVVE